MLLQPKARNQENYKHQFSENLKILILGPFFVSFVQKPQNKFFLKNYQSQF